MDAGFTLVPSTLTFISAAVTVRRVGVRAIPFDRRHTALREIKEKLPGVVVSTAEPHPLRSPSAANT